MLKLAFALLLSLFPVPVQDVSPPGDCDCGLTSIEPLLTEQDVQEIMLGVDLAKLDKEPLPPVGKCSP